MGHGIERERERERERLSLRIVTNVAYHITCSKITTQYVSIKIYATSVNDYLASCLCFKVVENNLFKGGINQYKHQQIVFYFDTK